MINELSDEAIEFGGVVREGIEAAGGVDILRRAVAEPQIRSRIASEVLDASGVWELDPRADQVELEAAAAVCRAAGAFGFPYPLVERLGHDIGSATFLVSRGLPRVATHVDLDLDWSALDLTGRRYRLAQRPTELLETKLGPFSSPVSVTEDSGPAAPRNAALVITLQAWWLLGLLDAAQSDTLRYTAEREQFGRALRKFQGVQFMLADSSVALRSLEELAKYTLWSQFQERDDAIALTDALALRASSLRSANTVLRTAHQLHGAMGFTTEVNLSWLSRASQSVRRLPEGESQTLDLLTESIERGGFAGLPGGVGGAHVDSERSGYLL